MIDLRIFQCLKSYNGLGLFKRSKRKKLSKRKEVLASLGVISREGIVLCAKVMVIVSCVILRMLLRIFEALDCVCMF